jgi:hypothetical protein
MNYAYNSIMAQGFWREGLFEDGIKRLLFVLPAEVFGVELRFRSKYDAHKYVLIKLVKQGDIKL